MNSPSQSGSSRTHDHRARPELPDPGGLTATLRPSRDCVWRNPTASPRPAISFQILHFERTRKKWIFA